LSGTILTINTTVKILANKVAASSLFGNFWTLYMSLFAFTGLTQHNSFQVIQITTALSPAETCKKKVKLSL
jgi:hypothetical protein